MLLYLLGFASGVVFWIVVAVIVNARRRPTVTTDDNKLTISTGPPNVGATGGPSADEPIGVGENVVAVLRKGG